MHHPLSEFRTLLEEKLIGWNLPAELVAQIEEHSTPVTFEKEAIVFLQGAPCHPVSGGRRYRRSDTARASIAGVTSLNPPKL
jgi:hypothetical protein